MFIIKKEKNDPTKQGKDCEDFIPLSDGTRSGDPKYCNLSRLCRQLGMKSDWYRFKDENGDASFDYFCRGVCVKTEEDKKDEEVS